MSPPSDGPGDTIEPRGPRTGPDRGRRMGRRHSAWSATAAALLVLTSCGAQTSSPTAAPPTLGTDPLRTDEATTPTVAVSSPPSDVGEASSGPPETTPQDVAGALFDVSS